MRSRTCQTATLTAVALATLISSYAESFAFDARSGYRWSTHIGKETAKAGIVEDTEEPMNFEGIILICDRNSFGLSVGPISTAGIASAFIKEKMPQIKFIIDKKEFSYKSMSIEFDEHDDIWKYQIDMGLVDGLPEAISGGKDISIFGDGIDGKLPRKMQSELGKFAQACRSMQTQAPICELERSLTGELRLASVRDWAYESDPGTTSFILRDSKRGSDGILRSSIVAELVANRMGHGIFSSTGKDLGVLVVSEAKINNSTDEKCPKLTTKFDNPGRLAIMKGSQRIGVIIDEQRLLSRNKM